MKTSAAVVTGRDYELSLKCLFMSIKVLFELIQNGLWVIPIAPNADWNYLFNCIFGQWKRGCSGSHVHTCSMF